MELQRTQQRTFTRCLVAFLVATSGMSMQESRAVSLFSMQKTAVVAPVAPGFVDFVKENQELSAITSVVVAGVISYAIYQMCFAPKTPISTIVQMRRARFDDDLARQRQTHRQAQTKLDAISEDNKKIVTIHFRRTHEKVTEGLYRALIEALEYDESNENVLDNFKQLLNETMQTFEEAILQDCRGKAVTVADPAIVQRLSNVMLGKLLNSEEEKKACAFLEASLQEYGDLLTHMAAEERKYMDEIVEYIKLDAAKYPKGKASDLYKKIKAEEGKEKAELEKKAKKYSSPQSAVIADAAQAFLTSADWKQVSVPEVFNKARARVKVLQNLFETWPQKEKAHMFEVGVRGQCGVLVVVGTVIAHKICDIVYKTKKSIRQPHFQKLFKRLYKNATRAFNDLSFDFANPDSRNVICLPLRKLSLGDRQLSREEAGQIDIILASYRDFIRGIRVEMDRYLRTCGFASDDGSPCTTVSGLHSYSGNVQPVLSWPYAIPGSEEVRERSVRISLNAPDPVSESSSSEQQKPRVPENRRAEVPRSQAPISLTPSSSPTPSRSTSSSSSGSASSMKEDFVHLFVVAAQNERETKKEALIKDVLKFFHGFRVRFADEPQYKSEEDSLRKQLESDLNLVMKQDKIDEPEIRRKVETAIRNVLSKLPKAPPVVAPSTVARTNSSAPTASTAAPVVHASEPVQAHKNEQAAAVQEIGTLTKQLVDAVHVFASAAKKDRASKQEAIQKTVVALLNAKMSDRVSDAILHNANNARNLRGRIDRELTFIAKEKEVDETVVLKKLESAIKTCEADLLRQVSTQQGTLPKKAKSN